MLLQVSQMVQDEGFAEAREYGRFLLSF